MSENKKKEEQNKSILRNIEQLEGVISSLRFELTEHSKNEVQARNEKDLTRKVIDKIVKEYKDKILRLENELKESKQLTKEVIRKYEANIKSNDNKIIYLKNELENKDNPQALLKLGIPKELIDMPKEKLALENLRLAKEAFNQEKQIGDFRGQSRMILENEKASNKALSDRLSRSMRELAKALEKNKGLQQIIFGIRKELTHAREQLAVSKSTFERIIDEIKKESDRKIRLSIKQKTELQVDLESQIRLLKKQIYELSSMLKQRELLEKNLVLDMQKKFGMAPSSGTHDYMENEPPVQDLGRKEENLDFLVKKSLINGDSKEKIVFDLSRRGFQRKDIFKIIEKIKK